MTVSKNTMDFPTPAFVCPCDAEFLLLSYPKSGSTWMRYCIEFLTERPTFFRTPEPRDRLRVTGHIDSPFFVEFLTNEPIILKRHAWDEEEAKTKRAYKKIILLIRNYKEVALRNGAPLPSGHAAQTEAGLRSGWAQKLVDPQDLLQLFQPYIDSIEKYHNHEGEKAIVYYEDLILSPKQTLINLMNCMQVPKRYENKLEQLMDNFKKHKNTCGEKYRSMSTNQYRTMTIDNKDMQFHQKIYKNRELSETIDKEIERMSPEFFELYLKHYKGYPGK